MGTLTHPLLTIHAAFPHPLLPETDAIGNTSQDPNRRDYSSSTGGGAVHIITTPLTVAIKRTLGSAPKPHDTTKFCILREDLLRLWERALKALKSGETRRAEQVLSTMLLNLQTWAESGREVNAEFAEMEEEVRRVYQELVGTEREVRGGITAPKPVLKRDEVRGRRIPTPLPSWSSASMSEASSSTNGSHHTEKSAASRHRKKRAGGNEYSDHRRESEEFVQEALSRGEPVTLFSRTSKPPPWPPAPQNLHPPGFSQRQPASIFKTPPGKTSRFSGGERDITPTIADPYGLRHDPRTPTSPRKRAALYDSPRWPTGGRPSPVSPDAPRTPPTPTYKGRASMGNTADEDEEASLYAQSVHGVERFSDDEDPAVRIWKGIDEEYSSPLGGIMRKRWRRREGSIRPSEVESLRSAR